MARCRSGLLLRLDAPEGHPCPGQLSLPLGLVVTANLVEGDDQGLGLHAALVPGRLDAGRPDA